MIQSVNQVIKCCKDKSAGIRFHALEGVKKDSNRNRSSASRFGYEGLGE